ncbi:MAG: hypothetical protein OEL58_07525 [Desulfobacteraceae bacterium]|nr:hypothetical protein [Desulfobacteraceae bacterium]
MEDDFYREKHRFINLLNSKYELKMEIRQQVTLFQAMEKPDFYPHPVNSIEQQETHISKVFLTGDYVY